MVELLVAMSILMLVTFIGNFAYSQYSRFWNNQLGEFEAVFDQAKGVSQLLAVVSDIQPYIVKNGDGVSFHYFEGGNQLLRAVVASSMSDESYPAAIELKVTELVASGEKQLVYRERVLDKAPLLTNQDTRGIDLETVLLTGFEDFTVEYFGYAHLDQWYLAREGRAYSPSWFGFYSGEDTKIPPEAAKISFTLNGESSSLIIPLRHFSPEQLEFYGHQNED